ncbi:hypothetical protein UlMin_008813, partial [Ulmus minor]
MRTGCYLAVSNQIAKALLPYSLSQFSGSKGIDMASHSLLCIVPPSISTITFLFFSLPRIRMVCGCRYPQLHEKKLRTFDILSFAGLASSAVGFVPRSAQPLLLDVFKVAHIICMTFQILRSKKIEFVVAPYEVDAWLAYLSSLKPEKGGIVAVITEDSDLLAFGMCVLAGCDFLPFVPRIGIAKSYDLVSKYQNQAVYNPDMKKLKHMRPFAPQLLQSLDGELNFLGP